MSVGKGGVVSVGSVVPYPTALAAVTYTTYTWPAGYDGQVSNGKPVGPCPHTCPYCDRIEKLWIADASSNPTALHGTVSASAETQ